MTDLDLRALVEMSDADLIEKAIAIAATQKKLARAIGVSERLLSAAVNARAPLSDGTRAALRGYVATGGAPLLPAPPAPGPAPGAEDGRARFALDQDSAEAFRAHAAALGGPRLLAEAVKDYLAAHPTLAAPAVIPTGVETIRQRMDKEMLAALDERIAAARMASGWRRVFLAEAVMAWLAAHRSR